jgi:enamidase
MPSPTMALVLAFLITAPRYAISRTPPSAQALIVALTHARIVDGTGAPAREDQTLVIDGGRIALLGNHAEVRIPDGARMIDLRGRTILPGLVMLHEHFSFS